VTSGTPAPHPTPGMCGDPMPMVLRGVAAVVCELRHGHPGWHETTDGAKWSPRRAPVPVSESRIATEGSAAGEPAGDGLDDLRAEMAAIAHAATDTEISRVRIKDLPSPWQMIENAVDALVAAGFRRVPEDAETLEAYDAAALNAIAGTLTDLHGFLPLNVRYGAAAAALRYVQEHAPGGSVSGGGEQP
jgi:hypothetical protein